MTTAAKQGESAPKKHTGCATFVTDDDLHAAEIAFRRLRQALPEVFSIGAGSG